MTSCRVLTVITNYVFILDIENQNLGGIINIHVIWSTLIYMFVYYNDRL